MKQIIGTLHPDGDLEQTRRTSFGYAYRKDCALQAASWSRELADTHIIELVRKPLISRDAQEQIRRRHKAQCGIG